MKIPNRIVDGLGRSFAQGDDPRSAVSWESQYQLLVKEVKEEEMRKKFATEAWQSQEETPLATPKRV